MKRVFFIPVAESCASTNHADVVGIYLSAEQKCKQIGKLALFTAPCRWEIRQTYKSDRIPKQLTEVYCLGSGRPCDVNPRYQVKKCLNLKREYSPTQA